MIGSHSTVTNTSERESLHWNETKTIRIGVIWLANQMGNKLELIQTRKQTRGMHEAVIDSNASTGSPLHHFVNHFLVLAVNIHSEGLLPGKSGKNMPL